MRSKSSIAFLVCGLLAAGTFTPGWAQAPQSFIDSVKEDTELAESLDIALDGRRVPIDADSQIRVEPKRGQDWRSIAGDSAAAAEVRNDWAALVEILQSVKQLEQERQLFEADLARIDSSNSESVAATQKLIRGFNLHIRDTVDLWQEKLGLSDEAFQRIQLGDENPSVPYRNIASYLEAEINRLQAKTKAAGSRGHLKVNVSAYVAGKSGSQQRIHVEPYDNISAGSPETQSGSLFSLSAAEASRLKEALTQTQSVLDVLKEIESIAKQTRENRKSVLTDIRAELTVLADNLRRSLSGVGDLAALQSMVAAVGDSERSTAEQKAAAARILGASAELRARVDRIKAGAQEIAADVNELRDVLKAPNLFTLLEVPTRVTALTEKIKATAQPLAATLAELSAQVDTLSADVKTVAIAQGTEQLATLWSGLKSLVAEAPGFASLVANVSKAAVLFAKAPSNSGLEAITSLPVEAQWPDLASAPRAIIRPKRSGVVAGNDLDIKITYQREDGAAPPPPETISLEVTEFNWYRKIDAALIFARATKGDADAKQWKSNLAATAHWFYRYRPQMTPTGRNLSAGKRLWNGINPGFGLHAASLSQGSDSVEFGLGGNLSLFDGMVTLGYGYNLSTQNNYYFAGLSLIEVLNRARNLGGRDD